MDPSDIVILEANAYLLEMRAFLKQSHSENLGARVLHVFDAASALGGMAKGRSSSKRLNRLCKQGRGPFFQMPCRWICPVEFSLFHNIMR